MDNFQPVIWVVQLKDGSQVREIEEDGKETIFDKEFLKRKQEFSYIGLKDVVNNILYSINLETGQFVLRGQNFKVAKELDGRVGTLPEDLDFRDGVIQFKASKPMELKMGQNLPTKPKPQTFNIGFKVQLPENFCQYKKGGALVTITHCQAMLSVDADTLQPCFSSTWTARMDSPDGKSYELKL